MSSCLFLKTDDGQQYTDYSCSTSIERLSRDVETKLREWHLINTDRHVSFSRRQCWTSTSSSSSLVKENKDEQKKSKDYIKTEESSPTTTAGAAERRRWSRTESAPARAEQHDNIDDASKVRLIRSETISWTVSWSDDMSPGSPVNLTLALWDADLRNHAVAAADLPLSLRREPFHTMPSDTLFSDFSTLFGIGQHVTLTLSDENSSDEEHFVRFCTALLERHTSTSCSWTLQSLLTLLLQTALNNASANILCKLPCIAYWGLYDPSNTQNAASSNKKHFLQLYPAWMSDSKRDSIVKLASDQRRKQRGSLFSKKRQYMMDVRNRQYLPPVLSGKCILSDCSDAQFILSLLPGRNLSEDSRLTVWGQVLLRHTHSKTVVLNGARHIYTYLKPALFPKRRQQRNDNESDWRQNATMTQEDESNEEESPVLSVKEYRLQCRQYAQTLLEQAVGATRADPLWGPPDDPVASVHCTVTWNGRTSEDDDSKTEPLISLPLRIRSRNTMSRQDWIDMEDSVERTLLDPLIASSFAVRIHWDPETSVTSLAANQRCVLAALIRTATLPPDILLQHLTNESVMDDWSAQIGAQTATQLMDRGDMSVLTRRLVDAMDWTSIGDYMVEPWEAEKIVKAIFDGTLTLGFPTPPSEVFASQEYSNDDLFSPLLKSAPAGRLLSMLFSYMSRLRGPSSMAVVWIVFVRELRKRWDVRESLPNMTYVPGLDPPPKALQAKRCVSTIGLQAEYSSFLHSSEPDPDDAHCLIGQKLQVFNVGTECAVAAEKLDMERTIKLEGDKLRSKMRLDDSSRLKEDTASVASAEIMNNATGDGKRPMDETPVMNKTSQDSDEISEPLRKRLDLRSTPPDYKYDASEEQSLDESQTSGGSKQEFYDAAEEGDANDSFFDRDALDSDVSMRATEHTAHVSHRLRRSGARCPVQGASLVASGDQVFAPYLQRPFPLTDDVILERRMMLSRGIENEGESPKSSIQGQIEISQRLQKPKLLSDMRAFKAANPGAVFTDFTNWYGNPGNPLDDYSDGLYSDPTRSPPRKESIAKRLEDACQAMNVLNATRDFWSDTWDEATPCQATEQQPLFDASSTVEMVLDSFETMHPASLVNQILAVNLSTSYCVLLTAAGDALKVGVVDAAVRQLREKIKVALELLSRDATLGAVAHEGAKQRSERLPKHASIESIRACDVACDAMGIAEAAICRATTLLHKFPRQYEVVHDILRRPEHDPVVLNDKQGRSGILNAIHHQQGRTADGLPVPSLREYVLRNTDEDKPCQLCVRFGDEGAFQGIDAEGGVLVCLTKCLGDY